MYLLKINLEVFSSMQFKMSVWDTEWGIYFGFAEQLETSHSLY